MAHKRATGTRSRFLARLIVGGAVMALAAATAPPASAHGGDESQKASDLVRQGIALIVNTPKDTMAIEDKINDAIHSKDPHGVDIDLVRQAKDAFDARDMHRVRALLEVSIGARPHLNSALPGSIRHAPAAPGADTANYQLATGDSPGPGIADDPLITRRHLDGRNTVMLVLSILAVAAGVALAIRFRPPAWTPPKPEAL